MQAVTRKEAKCKTTSNRCKNRFKVTTKMHKMGRKKTQKILNYSRITIKRHRTAQNRNKNMSMGDKGA